MQIRGDNAFRESVSGDRFQAFGHINICGKFHNSSQKCSPEVNHPVTITWMVEFVLELCI